MESQLVLGLGLILFAATCGGAFALPLRIRRLYAVENTMLIAHLFATIIIPLVAVTVIMPAWPKVIAQAGPIVFAVIAMGFGWGCGCVTFALGVDFLGLGLGFAIIMGLTTVVGSVIPMITRWSGIPAMAKLITLIGMAVCVCGVAVVGKAGALREAASGSESRSASKSGGRSLFVVGLIWCILSGVLSACANLGFHFAEPIGKLAAGMGVSPLFSTLPRWLPMHWGGYLAILIFMGSSMVRSRTYVNYAGAGSGRDFLLAVLMGTLHFLAQIPYGMGTYYLGPELGTSVGWVINIASSIIVANVLGNFTGEWRKAPRAATGWRWAGLTILIVSTCILASANLIK